MILPTVWFNKYLSNTWELLASLREQRRPGEFRVLCTHPRRNYPGFEHADLFEREPEGLDETQYLDYCVDVARRFNVALFFPFRQLAAILRGQARLEELGVQVLAAGDASTVSMLNSKTRVYAALRKCPNFSQGSKVRLPDHVCVHDLAGFDAAWSSLRDRHDILCIKPDVSVYGIGFHFVRESEASRRLRPPEHLVLDLPEVRRRFAQESTSRAFMLMEYLPGPERSVDCLARDGELLRCVVRRKGDGEQTIEDNPPIVAAVREIAAALRLTNLFNVQFRDCGGISYLLEINPRMSGGLPMACQSGLVLPLWAIRLALRTIEPADIPQPRTGLWIPQPEPMSSL